MDSDSYVTFHIEGVIRTGRNILLSILFIAGYLFSPAASRAVEKDPPRVLLVVFEDDTASEIDTDSDSDIDTGSIVGPETDTNTRIISSVHSRLEVLPIDFNTQLVPTSQVQSQSRGEFASSLLSHYDNRLVFYWDLLGEEQIHFFVKTSQSPNIFSRKLEGAGELSLEDVIALISLTTIELLLDSGDLTPPPPPPKTRQVTEPVAPAPPPTPEPPRLFIDAGYSLTMGAPTPRFAHGGQLTGAYRFLRFLRVLAGLGIESPYESTQGDISMSTLQLPVIIGLAAMPKLRKVRLGGEAVALVVASKNTPESDSSTAELKDPFWRVDFQLRLMARVEAALSPRIALFAGIGARILLEQVAYQVEGGPLLFDEYWRIQPTIILGLQLMAL